MDRGGVRGKLNRKGKKGLPDRGKSKGEGGKVDREDDGRMRRGDRGKIEEKGVDRGY